jgi:hypothetical protein
LTYWFFGWKIKVTVSPGPAFTVTGEKVRPSFPTSTGKSVAATTPARAAATMDAEKYILGQDRWIRGKT